MENQSNLDDQIKQAERDKLHEETAKAKSERLKIELEYEKLKKEIQTSWWIKGLFWQRFITVFLGISFLGFYINYVILPLSTIEALQMKLKNEIGTNQLYQQGKKLEEDSIKNENYKDSMENVLAIKGKIIIDLKNSSDSAIKWNNKILQEMRYSTNAQIAFSRSKAIMWEIKYKMQESMYKNLTTTGRVSFGFKEDKWNISPRSFRLIVFDTTKQEVPAIIKHEESYISLLIPYGKYEFTFLSDLYSSVTLPLEISAPSTLINVNVMEKPYKDY